MKEGNNTPDPAGKPAPGSPHMNILYVIIACAIVILAVVLVAKFGFNMDLLSPANAEMSMKIRQTLPPTLAPVQKDVVKPDISFRPETLCPANQTLCTNTCTNRMTDTENCGLCGKVCPAYNSTDRKCISGKCSNACLPNYYDCNQNTADGCEVNTENDAKNCGGCGRVCSTGINCTAYRCRNAIDISGSGPYETYNPPNQMKIE